MKYYITYGWRMHKISDAQTTIWYKNTEKCSGVSAFATNCSLYVTDFMHGSSICCCDNTEFINSCKTKF